MTTETKLPVEQEYISKCGSSATSEKAHVG